MNFSVIFYIVAYALKAEGLLMLVPAFVGLGYGEQEAEAFFICAAALFIIGYLATIKRPKNQVFYSKEGFVSVALVWVAINVFGCIPFMINGDIPRFADAFFEMVSGFTTTGSTILKDVEALSRCSLFWRSFSHWVGGMGILVFVLSVLPITGGSTMHLMRAESPGPQVGKIVPKIKNTAIILYVIYTVMTVVEIILLLISGMELFDALTLSFGSAGTGGFAVRNSGLADYAPASQYIVAIFIILFGVNFNVYFLIVRRHLRAALKYEEALWYYAIIAAAVIAITFNTRDMFVTLEETFRHSLFQVGSIITTTGYSTTDFNLFPEFSKQILVLLMFIGACAGSTGGGIKVSRFIVMVKTMIKELNSYIHPKSVKKIKMDDKPIEHEVVRSINVYFITFMIIFVASVIAISFEGHDLVTNFTAIAATINNIGPGLSMVGPDCNFGFFSDFSKLVIIFDMLAGRLELFPLLILFHPAIWKELFTQKITMRRKKKF